MSEINFAAPLPLKSGFLLPSRVMLSPMEGVTTASFIRAASGLGLADLLMTPFFSVTAGSIPSRSSLRKKLEVYSETGLPLIVQLIGHDADSLAATACRLAEIGVHAVNLNFACPSPTVIRHGSGGALLKDPEKIRKIVSKIRAMLPEKISLSVKLRSGFELPNVKEIIQAVSDAELIVFHFRTVKEMYSPVEHGLARIAEAVENTKLPVFGNGDIDSCESAEKMVQQTHCKGVAVARAFLRDPSLPDRIRGTGHRVSPMEMLAAMEKLGTPHPPLLEFARTALPEHEFRAYLEQLKKVNR